MRSRGACVAVCIVWAAAAPAWAQEAQAAEVEEVDIPFQEAQAAEADMSLASKAAFQVKEPLSDMRKASYVLGGVAGVGLLSGTTFALLAHSNRSKYDKRYSLPDTNGRVINAFPEDAQGLKSKICQQQTIAIVSYSVAGAALVSSAALFFLSPEWWVVPTLGVAPMQGGVMLSLGIPY